MLIALIAGGLLALFLATGDNKPEAAVAELEAKIEEAVEDEERLGNLEAELERMLEALKKVEDAEDEGVKPAFALLERRDATLEELEAVLAKRDAALEELDEELCDVAAALRQNMTAEEWQQVFAPRSPR